MAGHCKFLLAVIFMTPVVMLLNFSLSALSENKELFPKGMRELSDQYDSDIRPTSATFSIWGVIYTWQVLLIIFAIVNVFRKTADGQAYTNPVILTPAFFIAYMFNYMATIVWSFMFAHEFIELAFVFLFLIAFSLYICMFVSYKKFHENAPILLKQGRNIEIWLHRIFVHNGLGIYATWTTIATLLNLTMVMTYRADPGLDVHISGLVALIILTIEILVFVVTDLFFLDKFTRYTVTPYLVVIVALVGSIARNWDASKTNSIFSAVLLGFGVVAAVTKSVLMFYRHYTKPMYPVDFTATTEKSKA